MPRFRQRDTQRARELRNAATPAERLLWRYLSRSQLGAKFSRQMQIGSYFADFLCRQHNLVIELDGYSHDARQDEDACRDRYLHGAGYRVLRFPNSDVLSNVEGVVTAICLALSDRPTPNPSRKREGSR